MQFSLMHSCSFKFSFRPSGGVTISSIYQGISIPLITEVSKLSSSSQFTSDLHVTFSGRAQGCPVLSSFHLVMERKVLAICLNHSDQVCYVGPTFISKCCLCRQHQDFNSSPAFWAIPMLSNSSWRFIQAFYVCIASGVINWHVDGITSFLGGQEGKNASLYP